MLKRGGLGEVKIVMSVVMVGGREGCRVEILAGRLLIGLSWDRGWQPQDRRAGSSRQLKFVHECYPSVGLSRMRPALVIISILVQVYLRKGILSEKF